MTSQSPHAHLARPPHNEPPPHAPNAALMIDFDNVTMGIRSDLQSELKRLLQSEIIRGKVAVQRAYADWRRYPQYIVPLSESSIDLIFAPAYGSNKKNATDIRLAIDALELVFTRPEIGTFILLSGDSDFSSLVIKLKEYGKYVIGVGIRESSSDLLIQNCDEYYSYNELAGLTRETDATPERRDPWELVVEAVKQMTAHNDVMRSDRLKQVMQEIDPSFDEKNAGFSRFSKFVLEASHRGLVTLNKLDNGQYELALGPEVAGAAARPAVGRGHEAPARERRAGSGSRGGEGRSRRGGRGPSLSEAFPLLQEALGRLGGGERAVSADAVRDAMVEIKGSDSGPLEPERFPKLLRQAHDAEILDLSKTDDGGYVVKLRAAAERVEEVEQAAGIERAEGSERSEEGEGTDRESAPAPAAAEGAGPPAAVGGVPARGARFRRGSRGGRMPPPVVPKVGVVEIDPNFRPRPEPAPQKHSAIEPDAPPAGRESGGGGHAESGGRRGRGAQGERRSRGTGERESGGRSRGRRGGRGRGGRRRTGDHGTDQLEDRASPGEAPPPLPVAAEAQAESSPRPASPQAEQPDDGESFWSKVKRGLTGGA
jgi:uncharacterized protein (TIGR00288 family)